MSTQLLIPEFERGVTRIELRQRFGVNRKVLAKLLAGHTYRVAAKAGA